MGTLFLDGEGTAQAPSLVSEKFREVFGGEVSAATFSIKNPKTEAEGKYFCMKVDVEEIYDLDSFTQKKIEHVFKSLNQSPDFDSVEQLDANADLEYIFSVGEQAQKAAQQQTTAQEQTTPMKEQLKDIKADDPSPQTVARSFSPEKGEEDDEDLTGSNLPEEPKNFGP